MKMLSNYILDGVMEKSMDDSSAGFERRFARVQEFLRRSPFDGFTRKDLLMPSWHSIAALSNMAEAKKQHVAVGITTGTNDPLKTHLAVLTGFGLLKNNCHVDFLLMGEAGSVIDNTILRECNGFGLPPIAQFLDNDLMNVVMWYVGQARARCTSVHCTPA